jgi:hypothetical protein
MEDKRDDGKKKIIVESLSACGLALAKCLASAKPQAAGSYEH